MLVDNVLYYSVFCYHTTEEKESFWETIMNTFPIELSVSLNLLPEAFINVLHGEPWNYIAGLNIHIAFHVLIYTKVIVIVSKMVVTNTFMLIVTCYRH